MSMVTTHKVVTQYDTNKKRPVEYKAINERSKSGKGSFQFHWLSENKIKGYAETEDMYFAIRDGVTLKKIYQVPTTDVIPYLKSKSTGVEEYTWSLGS